jgi:iron complex outermembrane receptor protein
VLLPAACAAALAACTVAHAKELVDLSIEELSNIVVTSVSRRPEPLSEAAASVYVITAEDIRRSGARTLPEALRLAPNLQVARIDTLTYAITARGFNSNIANKLLVLIDGRTVYSPLFSGVFWEAQDVLLEDVDRIEVISGPGAATWGVNAVNGVINVITRSAADTQGVLAVAGGGNTEGELALRYGGRLGGDGNFRIYAKGSTFENTMLPDGREVKDAFTRGQAGFRADWGGSVDQFTLLGNFYDGTTEDRPVLGDIDVSGRNLLARWSRQTVGGSDFEVQAYYDESERRDLRLLQDRSRVTDLQFKHGIPWGSHRVQWGAGYRHARQESDRGTVFTFIPSDRDLSWYYLFAQDQVHLREDLELTLGARLEHNSYTGWEVLPDARLAWKPAPAQLLWASVSRPVRAPARLDREIFLPPNPPFIAQGGPNFESERATVLELGYRAQPTSILSLSVTGFQHRYENLRSARLVPGGFVISNEIEGEVTGIEAWGTLQATRTWRLALGGFLMDKDLRLKPGSNDPIGPSNLGNDPNYQVLLRSSLDLTPQHELDVQLRQVGGLPRPAVEAYTAVDLRVGWRVNRQAELSFVVQNLFDDKHGEFASDNRLSEFQRAAFLKLVLKL